MAIPSRLKYVYFKTLLTNQSPTTTMTTTAMMGQATQTKQYVKIKFVVTDLSFNRYIKRLSSGFIRSKFGLVHVALLVGNIYLEWNDSSLVKIREPSSMNPLFVMDVATITSENLDQFFVQVSQVVTKWNIYYQYNAHNCNCQHFVTDLLQSIHLESIFEKRINQNEPVKKFFTKVRLGKLSKLTLDLSKEMQTIIKENEKEFFEKVFSKKKDQSNSNFFSNGKIPSEITFRSHEQLDLFCHLMKKHAKNPTIRLELQEGDYYKILKAFDRAFWLRSMAFDKLQREVEKLTPEQEQIYKLSQPLEKHLGGCFFSEYDEENDKYKNSLIDSNDFSVCFADEPPKKRDII